MNEEKKREKRKELIGACLDCFVEKGLTVTTTKDLCTAAKLQNGGIYYYFSSKEEIVLACAEEAINRIEENAFNIVLENLSDIKSMMEHPQSADNNRFPGRPCFSAAFRLLNGSYQSRPSLQLPSWSHFPGIPQKAVLPSLQSAHR